MREKDKKKSTDHSRKSTGKRRQATDHSRSFKDKSEPFREKSKRSTDDSRPIKERSESFKDKPRKTSDDSRPFRERSESFKDKPRKTSDDSRPFKERNEEYKSKDRKPSGDNRPFKERNEAYKNKDRKTSGDSRPFRERNEAYKSKDRKTSDESRPFRDKSDSYKDKNRKSSDYSRPFKDKSEPYRDKSKKFTEDILPSADFKKSRDDKRPSERLRSFSSDSEKSSQIRLNKYVANSGICSRREADTLIESGVIKVNGKVITELGTKINADDVVEYANAKIKNEKLVYVLLNKPKDFITTMDDPQGRRTVMELVRKACRERIYPVGRLDRNTTGVLLFTNDGELAKKLIHPKYNVKKIYNVLLDRKLAQDDMLKISEGIYIDDEMIQVDDIAYVEEGKNVIKREIGIQIHSGQNRVVRKIFESLGYEVIKLDRVFFAGLTKKDLPRGKWRVLTKTEIAFLKMGRFN